MALTVCGGCRRYVHEGEGCPFCGVRPRTKIKGVVKAAVLTAVMPLGLAACYGVPPTEPPSPDKASPAAADPTAPGGPAPQGQDAEPESPSDERPAADAAPEEG